MTALTKNDWKAYSVDKELSRGDAVWPVMSRNSLTFDHVTADGQIVTKETGEAVHVRPAFAFVSVGVIRVSRSNP